MDDRKSWKRLIYVYAGAGALALVVAFVIARSASHSAFAPHRTTAQTSGNVVGVYSGIAPDATAAPKTEPSVAASPSPSPTPAASGTPSPRPSARPTPKRVAAAAPRKHAAAPHRATHRVALVADAPGPGDAPDRGTAAGHAPAIDAPAAGAAKAPPLEQTAAPAPAVEAAKPEAPAPKADVPKADEAVFAPQRIVDAQVKTAVQPDYSDLDRQRGAHGTSVVFVTIDPKGNVVNTAIGSSSGYASLDRAALSAARASQFVAPKINGRPATETYRMVYDFAP